MLSRTCFVLSCRVLLFKLRFITCCLYFFFFQAEDGIRDYKVTGVQTCALPISKLRHTTDRRRARAGAFRLPARDTRGEADVGEPERAARTECRPFTGVRIWDARSEERRVGKECRSRWSPYH